MATLDDVCRRIDEIRRDLDDIRRNIDAEPIKRVTEEKYGRMIQDLSYDLESVGRRMRYGR